MQARRPRYEEIAEFLRGRVSESRPGDRLPSDTELAEQFGVSRMTARHAVQVLEREDLLHREQGKGTFVSARPVPRLLGSALSFTESMRLRGLTASSEVLDVDRVAASDDDVAALGIADGATVVVLTRLRLADGVPMAIERAVLSPDVADAIPDLGHGSLHAAFTSMGRAPAWARARVSARPATARERRLLDLRSNGVVLTEHRTIYDPDDRPLEHTSTWYAAERYDFEAVMTGERTT